MLKHTINFKVNGVTYNNEEGKNIQNEIKRILKEYKKNDYFDELYNGYTNSEIKEMDLNISEYEGYKFPVKIVGDEYEGEECFKIYFKTYDDNYVHIGYVPKNNLNELTEWLTKEDIIIEGTLEIVGGKYKYCELYEDDYEEKERVSTKELTYGIEVSLEFYEKKKSNEKETIKCNNSHNEIKKQQDIESTIQIIFWILFISIGIFIFVKIFSFINWLFS